MATMIDYFRHSGYRPKFFLGDRVSGRWNKIPFIGTVAVDSKINDQEQQIHVWLDLPIKYKDQVLTMLTVGPDAVKPLKDFD